MKKSSTLWSGLKEALKLIEDHSTWVVGNGKGIHLWKDRWAGEKSVRELLMANSPFWKPFTNTLSANIKPTGWNFSPTMTYILNQVGIEVVGTDYQLVLQKKNINQVSDMMGAFQDRSPLIKDIWKACAVTAMVSIWKFHNIMVYDEVKSGRFHSMVPYAAAVTGKALRWWLLVASWRSTWLVGAVDDWRLWWLFGGDVYASGGCIVGVTVGCELDVKMVGSADWCCLLVVVVKETLKTLVAGVMNELR
ncbi:hypothetical protein IFM89_026388 [Coptis chinensis]|uniref:Uncharacterized protein n=1 Tax=Coptis chinensis TaxID=261450 RepID=A0A835I7C9_9MAGN|nr:hypothetical protein IFM89_026388 [Coptis chinensis]